VDEPAPIAPDTTMRVVAEAGSSLGAHVIEDGRFVIAAGGMLFDPRPDGSLALVSTPEAYAGIVGEDESLVGYGGTSVRTPSLVAASGEGGFRAFFAYGEPNAITLANGKTEASNDRARTRVATWRGKALTLNVESGGIAWVDASDKSPVPDGAGGHVVDDLAIVGTSLVAIARAKKDFSPASLVWRDGDGAATVVPLPTSMHGGVTRCAFVSAFDDRTYARCSSTTSKAGLVVTFHRFDGRAWEQVFADAENAGEAASIASDGSLFVAKRGSTDLMRCLPRGGCALLDREPTYATSGAGASWTTIYSDVVELATGRTWQTFGISTHPKGVKATRIESVVARTPDDVWAIASAEQQRLVLHSGPEHDRVALPSETDARVIVRNAKPPTKWIGHCDQVFVRLPRDAAKRLPEIKGALAAAPLDGPSFYGVPYGWDLVEGRLGGEPVTGVVLHRADAEAPLDPMERAATKLVSRFTTNPVTQPDAFCTLPELDERLAGSE
jgi:hypothetical protein